MENRQSNKLFLGLVFISLIMVVGLFFYNSYHNPSEMEVVPKIDVIAVKAKIKNAGLIPTEAKYYEEMKQ